jgi:heme-degrading monooxygenase HmoA
MPALPWKEFQPIDPGRRYAAMASRLPLRAHRSVPGFLLDAMRIRGQLAHAPGLVGYALDAQPARKTFFTISVWEDDQSLSRFAAGDPHRQLTKGLAPQMGPSHFEFFQISGADLPLDWDEVRRRLATVEKQ